MVLGFSACTQNQVARSFGGDAKIEIPTDKKLVNLTWKENSLWVLTRPRRQGELPETFTFKEDSSLGLVQGTVTIVER